LAGESPQVLRGSFREALLRDWVLELAFVLLDPADPPPPPAAGRGPGPALLAAGRGVADLLRGQRAPGRRSREGSQERQRTAAAPGPGQPVPAPRRDDVGTGGRLGPR
jgi:hypothetical protein